MSDTTTASAQEAVLAECRSLLRAVRSHPGYRRAARHYRTLESRVDGIATMLDSFTLVRPDLIIDAPEWFRRVEHTRQELLHALTEVEHLPASDGA